MQVDRRRIMDQRLDTGRLQMLLQPFALGRFDDVEVKDVETIRQQRQRAHRRFGECVRVGRGDLGAAFVPALEVRKPRPQDRRLQFVEPAVHTYVDVVIAVGLPVLADSAQTFGELVVVRYDRAPVAERGEVLRRVKAEATEPADRSRDATVQARARRLRAILYNVDAALGAETNDRVGVCRLPVKVDGYDGARPLAERVGERRDVHRPGRGLYVAEN